MRITQKWISPEFLRVYDDLKRNRGMNASFVEYTRQASSILRANETILFEKLKDKKKKAGRPSFVSWYGLEFRL